MNSAADLKAFCGKNNGVICTSSNARKTFDWAFAQGERIFFFPDEHLGRNTANAYGIPKDELFVWDFNLESGKARCRSAQARESYPLEGLLSRSLGLSTASYSADAPGASRESRSSCIRSAPKNWLPLPIRSGQPVTSSSMLPNSRLGASIAIGTELNLIDRLAHMHPDKKILELAGNTCAMCVNMYRTTLNDLAYTLDNLETIKPMSVPDER